jgi:hypothetical protein
MAANLALEKPDQRRRARRPNGRSVADLAGDVLSDIAMLFQAELQLLRAELSEKLIFAGFSAALIGLGIVFLMATIVLALQAAIAGLVAYGISWPIAILLVAGATLVVGAGSIWLGMNRLSLRRLAPSRTFDQLQKDAAVTKIR